MIYYRVRINGVPEWTIFFWMNVKLDSLDIDTIVVSHLDVAII